MALQFEYVSSMKGTYGFFSCSTCGTTFHGRGTAIHKKDCPVKSEGYEACTYHFGPEEVEAAKQAAKSSHTENVTSPNGSVSISVLRANMPYLLTGWSVDN